MSTWLRRGINLSVDALRHLRTVGRSILVYMVESTPSVARSAPEPEHVVSAMAPAFRLLRAGLHVVMLVCAGIAVAAGVKLISVPGQEVRGWLGIVGVAAFVVGWAGGAVQVERGKIRENTTSTVVGLSGMAAAWILAASQIFEAAYLVFPFCFALLFLLGMRFGTIAVMAATACAILFISQHLGFSFAVVIGPVLGASVSIMIGWALRAVAYQAALRESLLQRLLDTERELTVTQREAGIQAERARLAGEIHDGVSQSLSSIQMLLHAAERGLPTDDAHRKTKEYIVMARSAAEDAQSETRGILRRMAPAALSDETLTGALERIADVGAGPAVVVMSDDPPLTMSQQAALLRIAQGAVGNARQHSRAHRVLVSLEHDADSATLTISDDGVGFVPGTVPEGSRGRGHFGLALMRERAEQMGGEFAVESRPGQGTRISVRIPLESVDGQQNTAGEEEA